MKWISAVKDDLDAAGETQAVITDMQIHFYWSGGTFLDGP